MQWRLKLPPSSDVNKAFILRDFVLGKVGRRQGSRDNSFMGRKGLCLLEVKSLTVTDATSQG